MFVSTLLYLFPVSAYKYHRATRCPRLSSPGKRRKALRERTWKEADAGEENWTKKWSSAIKRKNSWQSLFSFMVLRQGFSCYGRCPVFLVWGASLVSGWGTVMEESRWRIIAGLIASALLTHPHLLKGDPWGFLLLSRSQRSPLSGFDWCARLWPSPLTDPGSVSQFQTIDFLAVVE